MLQAIKLIVILVIVTISLAANTAAQTKEDFFIGKEIGKEIYEERRRERGKLWQVIAATVACGQTNLTSALQAKETDRTFLKKADEIGKKGRIKNRTQFFIVLAVATSKVESFEMGVTVGMAALLRDAQFNRHSPYTIQIRGNRTTFPPPRELYPLCSHPMA